MTNERTFYHCEICGNLVGLIENAGVVPECCGQPMVELTANTADASKEKHVPALSLEGCSLSVAIGSAPHPMTEAHHIVWIAVAQGRRTQRQELDSSEPATTQFHVAEGSLSVYAYCNLHGLWKADL